MSEKDKYTSHQFVSAVDWPFEDNGDGMAKANLLAPNGWEWMRIEKHEPGYILMEYEGDE